jgi:hypothetical protein
MSMYRIVGQQIINGKKTGGVLLSGRRLDDAWDLSIFEVNGHRELSVRQHVQWEEVGDWQEHRDACGHLVEDLPVTPEQLEESRLRNLRKAAQRAQTACRRLIKGSDFREMLTITYRENQEDRELCKAHFKEWVRRMKNALPKFQYCASFERQERGAMHVHCATNKLPRFARYKGQKIEGWVLGTTIWREIVGHDNGLVFVGGKPRWGSSRRRNQSIAKIAAYVSKYIMKDYDDAPMGSNRYSRSNAIELPKPVRETVYGVGLDDLIRRAFETKALDSVIVSHRIGYFQDSYWLCTEPAPPPTLH